MFIRKPRPQTGVGGAKANVMLKKLIDWLNLADYEIAKRDATRSIVSRYSRRSVRVQAGDYMTDKEYAELIARGDRAAERLAREFA